MFGDVSHQISDGFSSGGIRNTCSYHRQYRDKSVEMNGDYDFHGERRTVEDSIITYRSP
jgi:hypothetical protein